MDGVGFSRQAGGDAGEAIEGKPVNSEKFEGVFGLVFGGEAGGEDLEDAREEREELLREVSA